MTKEEPKFLKYHNAMSEIAKIGYGKCPKCSKGVVKRMEHASNEYRCDSCDFRAILG